MSRQRDYRLLHQSGVNRPGIPGGSRVGEVGAMSKRPRFSQEVRERAVRLVVEHASDHPPRWAAITSIASQIGYSAQTLSNWVTRCDTDAGRRPGNTSDEQARVKALEREVKELRRANDILRKASAYFAQAELDRRGS